MTANCYRFALAAVVLTAGPSAAQGTRDLRVVERLPGYECLALNMSYEDQAVWDKLPPVLGAPRAGAPRVGIASASVIALSPRHEVNGFVEVVLPNGVGGWVRADKLRPWVNENSPRTRCHVARMSDGTLGLDYARPR